MNEDLMKVRKKDQKNLTKVGVFITFLTIILMIMVTSIGKETSLFEPKINIFARVSNVSNLKTGSYVELKGIRIGTVEDIQIISDTEVEIKMKILKKELKWIKEDSKVSISTAGLVGDKYVEIFKGSKESNSFNPDKDFLVSEELIDFKNIMTKGESIAQNSEKILVKIDKLITKIEEKGLFLETLDSMRKSAKNIEILSSDLKDAKLNNMVQNINNSMSNLSDSSNTLSHILKRIEKGPGTLNALIYDDSVHDDLRALLGGAQRNKAINYFIRESIKNSEQRRSKD
jgi:phospholipid/cholesterol/gamma-HCH transport system substrate-binding protein